MWKIDRDYINDDGSRVGYSEEHTRIQVIAAAIGIESEPLPSHLIGAAFPTHPGAKELPKIRFRLKDDDGEVYYGGWLHDDDECLNQEAALSFGMSDAGCTTIEVKREGEWKVEIA